ncbi:MAG: dockerin type I repeat-containing protein [Ruminococcus sp.]|nr:dockerin type I repeat-containing protein [Ruminococcus sp.]
MTFKRRFTAAIVLFVVVLYFTGMAAFAAENMLGDVDHDDSVTIMDATLVQRYLAHAHVIDDFSESAADVDSSGGIEVTDVTYIQRWVTGMDTPYPIGVPPYLPTETVETTGETPTEPPTQRPTDAEGWGSEIYRP